jgi:hypothetical protein
VVKSSLDPSLVFIRMENRQQPCTVMMPLISHCKNRLSFLHPLEAQLSRVLAGAILPSTLPCDGSGVNKLTTLFLPQPSLICTRPPSHRRTSSTRSGERRWSTLAFPFSSGKSVIDYLILRPETYPQDGGTRPMLVSGVPRLIRHKIQFLRYLSATVREFCPR